MNEPERAEMVARAIDALIRGAGKDDDDTDAELESLIDIARARLQASDFTAKASLQHEADVWLQIRRRMAPNEPGGRDRRRSPSIDEGEFPDIVALRKHMATEAAALGQEHRHAVWEEVQKRLVNHHDTGGGKPALLRPFRRRADGETGGNPRAGPESDKARVQPIPSAFREMGHMAESTHEMARARVWARLASGIDAQGNIAATQARDQRPFSMTALALSAAAVALLALTLGPLPATGFVEHPAARLAGSLATQLNVREGSPPTVGELPAPTIVSGRDADAASASAASGVTFREPVAPPPGFELTSATFYPDGLSTNNGGTFVLTYAGPEGVLMVYQEAAGAGDLAVPGGATSAIALADGTPATLVHGEWSVDAEGWSWQTEADQVLIFTHDGVRTIIELRSETLGTSLLIEVAESLE